MRRFETSIKGLMQAKTEYSIKYGNEPIFLSNWDSDFSSVKIPEYDYNLTQKEVQKYYYLTDEINNKQYFYEFYNRNFKGDLDENCFTIAPNGTSCLMLSLMAFKEMGLNNVLVTTPVYFSTLNLLDELNYNVERLDLNYKNDFIIDLEKLAATIKAKNIKIIIVTNPLFGVGIELSDNDIKTISNICNKYDVWFVMDYIYGGLPWNTSNMLNYVFNNEIYNAIKISHKHIFIESISKRIFINGVKTALLFTTNELLRRILRISVFTIGSMSATQAKIVNELYSIYNTDSIIESISKNAFNAKRNYNKLSAILKNSNIMISNSSCGYFSLISAPKNENNIDDIEYAINILNKTGVLTTPHSRYLFEYNNYYSFRVNLLLDEYELINGIIRIKNLI